MIIKRVTDLRSGDRIIGKASPSLNPISQREESRLEGATVLAVTALPYGYTRIALVGALDYTLHSSHTVKVDNSTLVYTGEVTL